jgi:hypothetical protein
MESPAQRRACDDQLVARMVQERSTWDAHWGDLGDHFLPRSMRFSTHDRNKGGKKNAKLLNSIPARPARTLSAGMFSSITSPARPWFIMGLEDADLAQFQPVKEWLDDSTRIVRDIIAGSNFYKCAPSMFRDLGVFGTHAQNVDEDPSDVIRCYPFPVGSYYLANNARLAVDLCVRKFSMTARQIVERFGKDRCPVEVMTAYNGTGKEQWFDSVIHICGPNPDFDAERLQSRFKRYRSAYYLQTAPAGHYLSESGYDEFPIIAPRWETVGEDVYGTSPGMLALPDARSLMVYEKRLAQAFEKQLNPPLKAPLDMEQRGIDPTPGKPIFSSSPEKIGSVYDAQAFQTANSAAKCRELKEDIQSTMYVDLFLMLMNSDRRQITAEEIKARQEEKILALGEPLERLNDEALGPFIERVFAIADRQGRIPPPPQELIEYQKRIGSPKAIKVEYVSALHQVQRMVKLGQIDRALQFLGSMAGAFPEALDNFDADQAWQEYADGIGLPPRLTRSKQDRDKLRQSRAAAAAKQAQVQDAATAVQGAQVMSQTDTGGQNALTDLMRGVSGAA